MFHLREKLERRRLTGLWDYTLAYAGLILVILAIFYYFERTFVWIPDGEDIYFVIMRYTRDYLYEALKGLVHTGRLTLPQWDFSIGQGNNILVGLHFNPFFLFALLSPTRYLEHAYSLMVVTQLYCTGAAFCLFCRRVGQTEPFPMALGALVYTFCGFVFHAGFSHVYFISNFMLCLVLILVSAERYLQDGKWGCFVASIVLTMLCGYYYAYIDTLLMALYLAVRQLCVNGKALKKSFFQLLRLFLFYLLGFALSMVYFLPSVMNYFICARAGEQSGYTGLVYTLKEYIETFSSFAAPQFTDNWTQLSFFGIALIALTLLFVRRERETLTVRTLFVVLTVFLCLPYAGKVFNGFGYVTNRWCFGYALCVAMATVYGTRDLWKLTPKERKAVAVTAGIWMLGSVCLNLRYEVVTGAVLMALTLLAVLMPDRTRDHTAANRRVAWVTALAAVVHIFIYFLPPFQNEIDDYRYPGKMTTSMSRSEESAAKNIPDDGFYRTEVTTSRTNRFALSKAKGTSSYWSALPGKMTDYYLSFALAGVRMNYAIWGMDQSTILCALSSVKYRIAPDGTDVPYGFEAAGKVSAKTKSYQLFRNRYALPLGYTYDGYMTRSDFDALSPLQRQQAMLQCAVMDKAPAALPEKTPVLSVSPLSWEITKLDKVKVQEDGSYSSKANGTISVTFRSQADSETWVYLQGLEGNHRTDIIVSCDGKERKTSLFVANSIHYFQREGVAFNMGALPEGEHTAEINFTGKGVYTFDLSVQALPMSDYVRDVTERGEAVLENVREGTDQVSGSISLTQPRLLVLTIPHIGGWSATVDGQPAQLLEVNALYMGLMLDAGEHSILLRYEMPGLRTGAAITGAAAAGLGVYALINAARRRKNTKNTEEVS